MSRVQNTGWLLYTYMEDYTTHLYRGYNNAIVRIPEPEAITIMECQRTVLTSKVLDTFVGSSTGNFLDIAKSAVNGES